LLGICRILVCHWTKEVEEARVVLEWNEDYFPHPPPAEGYRPCPGILLQTHALDVAASLIDIFPDIDVRSRSCSCRGLTLRAAGGWANADRWRTMILSSLQRITSRTRHRLKATVPAQESSYRPTPSTWPPRG
jgi:hypothetical protein